MMDDKLALVLESLGEAGIQAFYVYLVFEYLTVWVFMGLFVWALRTMWKYLKENEL